MDPYITAEELAALGPPLYRENEKVRAVGWGLEPVVIRSVRLRYDPEVIMFGPGFKEVLPARWEWAYDIEDPSNDHDDLPHDTVSQNGIYPI